MKVTIYYKDSNTSYDCEKVVTIPENSSTPTRLEIYGADNDEYHNIDAMGLDYDVKFNDGEHVIIENQEIRIQIED